MPASADGDQHAGRHARGRGSWAPKFTWRVAAYALLLGLTFPAASAISRLVFHRAYLRGNTVGAFISDGVSLAIAMVGIALLASIAVALAARRRQRSGLR